MKTILLTAIGSYAAPPVIASLHAAGHRVIGCDLYPAQWNAAAQDVDGFFQIAPASEPEAYLTQLEEAVRREKVDFVIPLTDPEVDVLCACKARFAKLDCILCVPDEPCAKLCRNKLEMAHVLEAEAICSTIPTVSPYGHEPMQDEYPLMLKPLNGRSSQGQMVVRTPAAYHLALEQRTDYIAQPYLDGAIYTVDVARDLYGTVQCLARRELLRTVNGLGTTVRLLPDHPLEGVCAAIARRAAVIGVVNMEFIEHDGQFYFLEVNPRFSGGVGFSIAAGLDFAHFQLLCHEGESLPPRPALHEQTLTRKMQIVTTL